MPLADPAADVWTILADWADHSPEAPALLHGDRTVSFGELHERALRAARDSQHPIPKILLGLLLIASITLMFPHGEQRELSYSVGTVWVDQDLVALADQRTIIDAYGEEFNNTSADAIHVLVESIRDEIAAGRDPRLLPEKRAQISFYL